MPWKLTSPTNDLQGEEVHLWRVALNVPDSTLGRFCGTLAEDEILRSERFRFPELRRRYVAGRGALRAILAGYLSVGPERLKFGYTSHGKPFLLNSPASIQFNVSHSADLMVAAVCRAWPIGVDIEKEDPRFRPMEVAERYFSDREKKEIATQDDEATRLGAFLQIWTAKEAVLKATSFGLALELSQLEVGLTPLRVIALQDQSRIVRVGWHLVAFRPAEDYWGTLAVAGVPSQLKYRDFCRPL